MSYKKIIGKTNTNRCVTYKNRLIMKFDHPHHDINPIINLRFENEELVMQFKDLLGHQH
jgi:hypothetical protein